VKTWAVKVTECHVEWGSSSSKYLTSFSECTDEKVRHHHIESSDSSIGKKKKKVKVVQKEKSPPEPAPGPAAPVPKPKKLDGRLFLNGIVIRADSEGTDSYVVIGEVGKNYKKAKAKPLKSALIQDTEHLRWNFAFDLGEVTKDGAIEFTFFQSHKIFGDQPIGYATKDFSTIEVESLISHSRDPRNSRRLERSPTSPTGAVSRSPSTTISNEIGRLK
jgi:hypothetical protein